MPTGAEILAVPGAPAATDAEVLLLAVTEMKMKATYALAAIWLEPKPRRDEALTILTKAVQDIEHLGVTAMGKVRNMDT